MLVVNPGFELLIRSNAKSVVRITSFMATIPLRHRARRNVIRARRNLRIAKETQRAILINSVELYSMEAKIKAWGELDKIITQANVPADSELWTVIAAARKGATPLQTEIAELNKDLIEQRKSIVEHRETMAGLEQEANNLSEAIKHRNKVKLGILTPEQRAQMESEITQMAFMVSVIEKSVQNEASTSDTKN